jgi:hypothetical protein
MFWYFLCVFGLGSLLTVIILLSSKNGSKAAQLEALKSEIKKQAEEQARANRICQNVSNFSDSDITNKLHQIANEQSKRVQ